MLGHVCEVYLGLQIASKIVVLWYSTRNSYVLPLVSSTCSTFHFGRDAYRLHVCTSTRTCTYLILTVDRPLKAHNQLVIALLALLAPLPYLRYYVPTSRGR